MKRTLAFVLAACVAWASVAYAQLGLPFPGPGRKSGNPVITAPVSLGCSLGITGASTTTHVTTAAIPAGALVFVAVQVGFGTAQTISSISDGTNAYVNAVTAAWDVTTSTMTALYFNASASAVGSGATITATYSAASLGGTNVPVICAGYSTGTIFSPADASANAKQTPGTVFASGSTGTLAQVNELAIGFVGAAQNCTSVTEGAGFTTISPSPKLQGSGNNWCGNLAYKITTATTALNYSPTLTSSYGASIIATFKGF